MRESFAEGRLASSTGPGATNGRQADPAAQRRAVPVVVVLTCTFMACAFLPACSSGSDTSFSFLADPGQYEFYSCEQLATDMKALVKRRADLKALMDRADQSAGGTAVGLIAYRTDYISAGEQQKLLESAARSKNCAQPETWMSNTAVR
jgi:hypothetical protein